ncbi:MAG TPA: hypothetical protein PKC83_09340 [Gemmatimonadaceae bacterium]|nr:MAG: hypothetical protein ABS52_06620 [Gemmatimonadetes bacterium SCN 70-22]HMN08974.1 hypothetical protein [Gemmatimonadaceae bacterium]
MALASIAAAALALPAAGQAPRQTDADHYTRYELLEPGSARFRIIYEVTATTPGATTYFNVIRKGSIATDEAVYDRMTGKPLPFQVVGGAVARDGGVRGADSTGQYIRITLARPVPRDGEARLRIDKTYEDARSYIAGGDSIVYTRPLGIRRNAVVLPAGYELESVNYPSQVITEADGRIAVSFINTGVGEVPFVVKGRKSAHPAVARALGGASASRLAERAHQDREIVYFLQQPETHAFDLYHDYTESRPGVDKYLNVVRGGSRASNPSARILDTGESLRTRTLTGSAITRAGIDIGAPVTPEAEVVVIDFAPVKAGESVRLRISETYTDAARYSLRGDTLVWDRAFGRPANAMVLPAGWALANCSVPATVSRTDDARVRLDFVNPRNDDIAVLVTAVRR